MSALLITSMSKLPTFILVMILPRKKEERKERMEKKKIRKVENKKKKKVYRY